MILYIKMENFKAVFWALLAAFIWGTAPIFFKLGMRGEMPTLAGIFVHNLTATSLALIGLILIRENPFVYPLKEILSVALGGILGGFLGLWVYYKAVKVGNVSVVAPVAASSPLFSALLAHFILGESLSLQKLVGALLIVLGVALVSTSR